MKYLLVLAVFVMGLSSAQDFAWQALGEKTYATCSGCHQASGQGLASIFPPLAKHLPSIVAKEEGRDYLISVLLYGLRGKISVLGQNYDGEMPMWSSFSDEQIAAVLNHELHSWGNDALLPEGFMPILPAEVAALRNQGLSGADVLALRQALGLELGE
jgi:mono/diheme cytochrome c family protein